MLKNRLFVFLLFTIGMISTAAAEVKIGFVDTSIVMKEAPQAEAARKKLQTQFEPREKAIVKKQKKLKKLEDSLLRDTTFISASEKQKRERDIFTLKRDIKRAKEEFNEDLNIRRNEELGKLQKLVIDAIVAYAKKEKYDAILGESVLFANKSVDVTKEVLKMMQQNYQASSKNKSK